MECNKVSSKDVNKASVKKVSLLMPAKARRLSSMSICTVNMVRNSSLQAGQSLAVGAEQKAVTTAGAVVV